MSFYRTCLLVETKHHNEKSMVCGHCRSFLDQTSIVNNPKHIYSTGTMFRCRCGNSAVWTNSIRGDYEFVPNFERPDYDHRRGFCNDAFCGHCFGYFQPLRNGECPPEFTDKYCDRYGCETCKQNQQVYVEIYAKDREGSATTSKLLNFYRSRAAEVKTAAEEMK